MFSGCMLLRSIHVVETRRGLHVVVMGRRGNMFSGCMLLSGVGRCPTPIWRDTRGPAMCGTAEVDQGPDRARLVKKGKER